jgi:hypothetical protein
VDAVIDDIAKEVRELATKQAAKAATTGGLFISTVTHAVGRREDLTFGPGRSGGGV